MAWRKYFLSWSILWSQVNIAAIYDSFFLNGMEMLGYKLYADASNLWRFRLMVSAGLIILGQSQHLEGLNPSK
jgi:hypothetical protein